jgi:hypothetical protein
VGGKYLFSEQLPQTFIGAVVFVAAICSVSLELAEYEEEEILCRQQAV